MTKISKLDVILDDKKRDCCVNGVPPTGPVIVTLKHPRTEYGALYLMCSESKRLYELKRFTDSVPRCWLMDNTMIKGIYIYTMSYNVTRAYGTFRVLHFFFRWLNSLVYTGGSTSPSIAIC